MYPKPHISNSSVKLVFLGGFSTKLTFPNCGRTSRPFHRQREWITVARVSENMAPNPVLRTQNIPRMHNFPSSSKQDKCKDPCPPPPQSRKEAEIHNYTILFRTRFTFDYTVQRASVSLNSPLLRGQVEGAGHDNASILKNNRPAPKNKNASKNENETERCRARGAGVNQTNTLLSKLTSQPPTGQGSIMFSLITSSLTPN